MPLLLATMAIVTAWIAAPGPCPAQSARRSSRQSAAASSDGAWSAGLQLVRGRPRILVPEARLPAIAARARGKLTAIYQQHVKKDSDGRYDKKLIDSTLKNADLLLARSLSLLLCYRIERNDAYRQKALALARTIVEEGRGKSHRDSRFRIQSLAIIYDWLHDTMTKEEKTLLRDGLVRLYRSEQGALDTREEFVSGHAHLTTASLVVAAIALCDGSGEFEKELARAVAHWEQFLRVARRVASDGGYHLGWRYGRSYVARTVWMSEILTMATGTDIFAAEKPWLAQLGYHLVYGLRPDDTYLRIGDSHRGLYLNLPEDLLTCAILGSRYGDPHLGGHAAKALRFATQNRSCALDAEHVYTLLFFDPDLPVRGPEDLPLVRAFRMAGNYTLRSGWGPDDTVVLFRAMPWYHLNHERRDFSSFTIYCHGGLAVHGGTYMTGDPASEYGGLHLRNYAWRSIAHNTVTVLDPNEKFCSPVGPVSKRCQGPNLWVNDGGQLFRSTSNSDATTPFAQPRNADEMADTRFAQGTVPVYEDRPELTWIVADATRTYSTKKMRLFQRSFVFLKKVSGWKQPVIVVFDHVESTNPAFPKAWILHTVEIPRIEGKVALVTNTTRVPLTGNSKPQAKDTWLQYGGKMFLETLLPADAKVQFVGGNGKEFWVDGANQATQIREVDRLTEPGIGRIEVTPGSPAATDFFLHVLSPTAADDPTARPVTVLLEQEKGIGLVVADHVLLFPTETGVRSRVAYRVDRAGPLLHAVMGLPAGARCRVTRSNTALEAAQASENGLLLFRASGGADFEVSATAP